jgi:hypothetical protein
LWAIGLGGKRLPIRAVAALVLGSMFVGAAILPYNKALTGDSRKFPIMAYTEEHFAPKANAYGFGPERGMGWPIDPYPGHGPLDALVNSNLNTASINADLFGWSTGSLIFILAAVFAWNIRREDALMILIIVINFVLYFFYYFSGGPDFAARYWFLMILPCVVLTVRGIDWMQDTLAARTHGDSRVALAVACLCLFAAVNYLPWRAVDKYFHYLGMRPDVRSLAREHAFGRSLVLVRGEELPDYVSAATFNPLDFHAEGPVYARDSSKEIRARLLGAYPDRPIWILEGPTVTGSGYKIIAGPIRPDEIARIP